VKVPSWVLGFALPFMECNVSFIAECWANFDLERKKMLNSTNTKEFSWRKMTQIH
jgi:hypothetical protein